MQSRDYKDFNDIFTNQNQHFNTITNEISSNQSNPFMTDIFNTQSNNASSSLRKDTSNNHPSIHNIQNNNSQIFNNIPENTIRIQGTNNTSSYNSTMQNCTYYNSVAANWNVLQLAEAVNNLSNKLTTIENNITKLNNNVKSIETAVITLYSKVTILDNRDKELNNKFATFENKINNLDNKITNLQENFSSFVEQQEYVNQANQFSLTALLDNSNKFLKKGKKQSRDAWKLYNKTHKNKFNNNPEDYLK